MPKPEELPLIDVERVAIIADRVGQTLRRAFEEAATEPLPQAFEELLRQMR